MRSSTTLMSSSKSTLGKSDTGDCSQLHNLKGNSGVEALETGDVGIAVGGIGFLSCAGSHFFSLVTQIMSSHIVRHLRRSVTLHP